MKLTSLLFFIAILIPLVISSGTLKIKLKSFSRPSGTLSDGSCCDFNGCSCDPFFQFCWRGYLTSINSAACSNGFIVTSHFSESNVINFGSSIGGISNPLTTAVNTEFTGRMQLYIEVIDYDPLFGHDFIDKVAIDFTVTSLNTLSTSISYVGQQGSTFTIGKTLTCSTNFYGTLCATYCLAQDSNQNGHYTCNTADGSFVCRNGYTGSNCRTAICTTGCLNGDCTVPFTCVCDSGWTSTTCSECIPRADCDSIGGFCDGPFNCKCLPGYEGNNCQDDTNFCEHNPQTCNNGVCTTTGINAYSCSCYDGYTGANCETDIDLCAQDPCVNGLCINYRTDYECDCVLGYEGKNCTSVVNNCLTSDCAYGTCMNQIGSYTCDCSDGFTGDLCDIEINECDVSPCVNGNCLEFVNGYVCNCTDTMFIGRNCSIDESSVTNPDFCDFEYNPCLNGASCTTNGPNTPATCGCIDGYSGTYCGDNTDNCPTDPAMNPCNNSGVCVDLPGNDFQCTCQPGFQGPICSDDINECDLSPCNNEGVCENTPGSFGCDCTVGYEGQTCLDPTDYCAMGNLCDNGATCLNNRYNYTCQCVLGFRGEFCVENIEDCVNVTCGNGTCVDGVNAFMCACVAGYTGIECDSELDECVTELNAVITLHPGSSSVCGVYGFCVDVLDGFDCSCNGRYTGDLCRDAIRCETSPCNTSNIVECVDGVTDTYECVCLPGFTGPQCDIDIDECAAFPCHNSAPCIDGRNDYYCDCISPWKGKNCRYDNTSCLPNPCNNGVCFDVDLDAATYNCTCPSYTTGFNCESDLDECTTGLHFCPDGINCTNTVGSYVCECDNQGSGVDLLTCAVRDGFGGGQDTDYIYFIVLPIVCFLLIALIIFFLVLSVCCCIARRHNGGKQAAQGDFYQSLDVNKNYTEIADALPHELAVTTNPDYATAGGIDILKPDTTAVTSNPLYAGLQAEENIYLPEPNLSTSLSAQKINKSAYNDISELPVAADFKGIYNDIDLHPRKSSTTNTDENEYGNI